jgi:hypothetical protein
MILATLFGDFLAVVIVGKKALCKGRLWEAPEACVEVALRAFAMKTCPGMMGRT